MNLQSPTWRRPAAIFLALLVLVMAVALFSPLHKHKRGSACSMNNLETQMADEVTAGLVLPLPALYTADRISPVEFDSVAGAAFQQAVRGPPACLRVN